MEKIKTNTRPEHSNEMALWNILDSYMINYCHSYHRIFSINITYEPEICYCAHRGLAASAAHKQREIILLFIFNMTKQGN